MLSNSERVAVGALVLFQAIERAAFIGAAWSFASGVQRVALVFAMSASGAFVLRSAVRAWLGRAVRLRLVRTIVDRLLVVDTLDAVSKDSDDPTTTAFVALHNGERMFVENLPGALADALVTLGLAVAFLASPGSEHPHRLALLAGATLAFLVAALLVVGVYRVTARLEGISNRAFGIVYDDVVAAIRGREEIVASGSDGVFRAGVDGHVVRWRQLASRSDTLSALVTRAPMVLVFAAVALWLLASASTSNDVRLAEIALLATASTPFVGLVRSLAQLAKDAVRVRPLIDLLHAPEGPQGRPSGNKPPVLPARIEWEEVSFAYGHTASSSPAVREVTLRWDRGVLALTGPNGSGKSTLLRMLLGLAQPQSGQLRVGGNDLFDTDLREWRKHIAYLPQRPYFGEEATSLREAMKLTAWDASDASLRIALERVSLWDALAKSHSTDPLAVPVRALSAGQKQRLALARLVCRPAPLILLDEPDANLDQEGLVWIATLIGELRQRSMIAMAVHTPLFIELADVRAELLDGRVQRIISQR